MWPPIAPAPMTVTFIAGSGSEPVRREVDLTRILHHNDAKEAFSRVGWKGQGLDYRKHFRVKPGQSSRLNKLDPSYTGKPESEDEAKEETERHLKDLARQQALLYAEHKHSVLIVLQAHGRRRQGRHDQARVQRRQPARRRRRQLQAADRRSNSRTTFSGASTPMRREPARSSSSTARTTRTCWSRGSTSSSTRRPGSAATGIFAISRRCLPQSGRRSSNSSSISARKSSSRASRNGWTTRTRNWKISESDYSERKLWDDYVDAYRGRDRARPARMRRPGT